MASRRFFVRRANILILVALSVPLVPTGALAAIPYVGTPVPAVPGRSVSPDQIAPDQTVGSVSVSPFLANVRIESGEATTSTVFIVSNSSGQDEGFTISAVDFGTLNDTGGLAFSGSSISTFTRNHGLIKWLQLSPSHVTILPGQSEPITATITNDTALGPGGHYAAIIITRDTAGSGTPGTITVQQKVSALLFATKAGGEVYDMHLLKLQHDGGWRQLPALITLTFQNTGNTQVIPRGSVDILNPRGTAVAEGIINQASAYVLPGTSRQFLVQPHQLGGASWLPGRITIAVNYRYDGHDQFATKRFSFTYWNPLGLAAVAAMLAVLVYVVFKLWRRGTIHNLA